MKVGSILKLHSAFDSISGGEGPLILGWASMFSLSTIPCLLGSGMLCIHKRKKRNPTPRPFLGLWHVNRCINWIHQWTYQNATRGLLPLWLSPCPLRELISFGCRLPSACSLVDVRLIVSRGCTNRFYLEVVPRGVHHVKCTGDKSGTIKNQCASNKYAWLSEIVKYRTLRYSYWSVFLSVASYLHILLSPRVPC